MLHCSRVEKFQCCHFAVAILTKTEQRIKDYERPTRFRSIFPFHYPETFRIVWKMKKQYYRLICNSCSNRHRQHHRHQFPNQLILFIYCFGVCLCKAFQNDITPAVSYRLFFEFRYLQIQFFVHFVRHSTYPLL